MNANYVKNIYNYTNNAYSVKVIKKYLNDDEKNYNEKYIKNNKDIVIFCEKYADETNPDVMMQSMMNYYNLIIKHKNYNNSYINILKSYNKKILLNELIKVNMFGMNMNELCKLILKNKNKNKIIYEVTKYFIKKIKTNKQFGLSFSSSDKKDSHIVLLLLTGFNILTQDQIYELFEYYCGIIEYDNITNKENVYDKILHNYIKNSEELSKEIIEKLILLSSNLLKIEEKIKKYYYAKNRKEILSIFDKK